VLEIYKELKQNLCKITVKEGRGRRRFSFKK